MKKLDQYNFFFIICKRTIYYQRNREVMLNRANEYYENNKERKEREKVKNKYRELSEEEKNIKREYRRKKYHKMSEEDNQIQNEYQRNYRQARRHLSKM